MHGRPTTSLRRWGVETLLLAAVYVAAARVGFLIAVPPGNVTVLWPPSGIALAAVLIIGRRAATGAWLGSFAANAWFLLPLATSATIALLAAGAIATASTAQALVGAWLFDRYIGRERVPETDGEIVRFLLVTAAACPVAATGGVACLVLASFLPASSSADTWWTWWLGDYSGILLVTPAAMLVARNLTLRSLRPEQAAFPFLCGGIGLSQIAFVIVRTVLEQRSAAGVGPIRSGHDWLVLLTGLLFTGLLGLYMSRRGRLENELFLAREEVIRDLARRRNAETALRENAELYRLITENATDLIYLLDIDGQIVFASPSVARLGGHDPSLSIGSSAFAGVHPDDVPQVQKQWDRVCAGAKVFTTFRLQHADATWRWIETWAAPVLHQGKPHVLAVGRDISERRQAEQSLRLAEEKYRSIFDNAVDGMFQTTPDGRFITANQAMARMLGYASPDELIGERSDIARQGYVRPERREEFKRLITAHGSVSSFEYEVYRKDGSTVWLSETARAVRDVQGRVLLYEGSAEDVSERMHLEEQFRQAQKMEAVGQLAGGVAHDFNNLLTVIIGYSDLVFNRLRPEDPARELVAEIQKSGERAARLTRQLLAFSRKQVLQPQVLDLNVALHELTRMLRRLIGEHIELVLRPGAALGLIQVDPGQLEQALINIALNARDAMPDGGRLTLHTRNVRLHPAAGPDGPAPQSYTLLEVSDTGQGMDDATRAHIFEPFFTTKGPGKGTGLGLAMVYGFVKQSEGHIEVDSSPGAGTTFRIYLPQTTEPQGPGSAPPGDGRMPGGTETILLVEDESEVRQLVSLVLKSSGYTVLEAKDGQDAVWIAQQRQGPIDLLLTDMVMPRMSGRQLAGHIAPQRPGMKVLFISGCSIDAMGEPGTPLDVPFLAKPVTPTMLAQKVREVLDAS